MKTLRLIVVCLVVLILGSCAVLEFIFGSVFPSTLVLAKAQADLSGKIDADAGSNFKVRVVETGTYSYVVVTGSQPTTGNIAFFFDMDLDLKATIDGLDGSGVMADADGYIVVGSAKLNAIDLSDAGTTGTNSISSNGNDGNDGFISGAYNVTNIYSDSGSNTFGYSYNIGWGTSSPGTATLSSSMSNLQIYAILDDGDNTGNVILVIGPSGGGDDSTSYFVTIKKSDFLSTIQPNLVDNAPQRDKLDTSSFGFAEGKIVAYDRDSSSYVRIDPSTAKIRGSFYSAVHPSDARYAYPVSGGSFYIYDTKSCVLTKYAAWW
jgi:hypothetical protein